MNHLVGKEDAKLALALLAINPRCGGCILVGGVGTGKSLLARSLKDLLPDGVPFTRIPLHVGEEAIRGGYDFELSFRLGETVFTKGILARSAGGILMVDDLHLLSSSIVSILLRALDEGQISLVATVNPAEGSIPPAVGERAGLQVFLNGGGIEQRVDIMRWELQKNGLENGELRDIIFQARKRLKEVKISEEVIQEIVQRVMASHATSHRRDIFLFEASRAYAALRGEREVRAEHVEKVAPLVLRPGLPPAQREAALPPKEKPQEGGPNSTSSEQDGTNKAGEEVFEVGSAYEIKRISFPMDRISRLSTGRRTPTKVNKKGGKGIGVTLRGSKDIALGATIRAAAPYQRMRGRTDSLIIREEDFRFWRRSRRMGHLVIFVTDASGSMGVNRRMIETKGAILSLLLDCYRYRDQVAMVAFRGEGASVLLPPTSSVTLAVRRLREMPVGGKTPLAQGLITASRLVLTQARKSPETRFLVVLITDGRANYSSSGAPVMKEIGRLTEKMRKLPRTDFLVIDTEDKNSLLRTDRAKMIAHGLSARYYAMPDLAARKISGAVRTITL